MSLLLFVLAAVCAVNAPRARTAVPPAPPEGTGVTPVRLAALGAALTLVALVPFAAFASPALDAVSMSPPTVRLAVGLVLVATGILHFGGPGPDPEPALSGWWAAVVPVAFPTLLSPGVAGLTVVASVDLSAWWTIAGAGLALATLPLVVLGGPEGPVRRRVVDGLARVLAGLLVLVGLALLFDGVFDI